MGLDGMVIIGHRYSKSTFVANKGRPPISLVNRGFLCVITNYGWLLN